MLFFPPPCVWRLAAVQLLASLAWPVAGATLAVRTNQLGATPTVIGYNAGHFFSGSNTRDWWRYAGVNGARLFIAPAEIEATDDLRGWGDGVTNLARFLERKAAVRAAPWDTNLINWPYFSNRYETVTLSGANKIKVNHACRELRRLGLHILANITASRTTFPLSGTNDWAGQWELWQHYYAQAFHLGREFDVQRFQMFNEPNHSSAGGLTIAEYLQRLQLASDAIQSALDDVNRLYGRALQPLVLAPATAGSSDGSYPGWGEAVVTNRHRDGLGSFRPDWWLVHQYDFHQYNSAPANFGADLAELRRLLDAVMAPEPPFPVTISEFNVHTAAVFDSLTETLDSPTKYARFGAIAVNLAQNACEELYAFKFSQTYSDGSIKKNGMHYVDNFRPPYDVGGITQAGEVWRLFAQAARPGGVRLALERGVGTEDLDWLASHAPGSQRYALLAVNNTASPVDLTVDLRAWNLPAGQRVLVQEVSEELHGGGRLWANLAADQTLSSRLGAYATWLLTAPARPLSAVQTVIASDDALVKDGVNRDSNYGLSPALWIKNNSTNANARNVSFLKFGVPAFHPPDLEFAVLRLWGAALNGGGPVLAYVYALTNHHWSQAAITWSSAPHLRQDVPAGEDTANNFVTGVGEGACLAGQLVASGNTERELFLDVTELLRAHGGQEITFLIAREVRFAGDVQEDDGLSLVSREADPARGPRLDLVRRQDGDGDGLSDESETETFGTHPGLADTDADGLSDGDEILTQGTNPQRADTDGDGALDGDELLAATNPLDPASSLRIAVFQSMPGLGFRLEWPAATNRFYRVYRKTDLFASGWQELRFLPGTNEWMIFTDAWAAGSNFPTRLYRLGVER